MREFGIIAGEFVDRRFASAAVSASGRAWLAFAPARLLFPGVLRQCCQMLVFLKERIGIKEPAK